MTKPVSPVALLMPRRIAFVGAVLLLGFGTVWAKLYHLQCHRHVEISQRVEEMHRQQRLIPAHRGSIWDRNGELLAQNRTTHDLYADTLQLRDLPMVRMRLGHIEKTSVLDLSRRNSADEIFTRYRHHVAEVIAETLSRDNDSKTIKAEELDRLLADEKRVEFVLMKGLQDEDAESLRRVIEEQNIIGVNIQSGTRRFYPAAERLTHVLGYVNSRNEGQEGIEATLNAKLKGEDGHQWIERDRKGREITTFRGETVDPQHGQEITLTIDMQLQEIMEETLEEAFEFYHPRKIVAVLVEPGTGAIRAMASRPHYERSDMGGTLNNLAIGTHYEPGSVFKIVAYSGVFDRGLVGLDTTINVSSDQKIFAGLNIHDHLNSAVTVLQAFAKSSNRGAYLMANKLGDKNFLGYVKNFGFGQKTGIPLTGEVTGIVMERKTWDNLTYSRMAIGHAVTATPLQMAMAVSAIANGGTLMKPQLIEEIRDDKGRSLDHLKAEPVRRVCSTKAANLTRAAMEAVVSEKGTGFKAAIPGIRVAGKTGTAQLYKKNGKGIDDGHYCVSFAGFAPAENPEFTAIIVLDDPHAPQEELLGGILAAPIFSKLMQRSLQQMAVARSNATKPTLAKEGGEP